MSVTGLGTRRQPVRMPVLGLISGALLLAALIILVVEMIGFSQDQDRLRSDITVAGVPVGGLTPTEAQARWEAAYARSIVLDYQGSPIILDPASVGFSVNSEVMLAAALAQSREESSYWLSFWNYLWRRPVEPANIDLVAEYQQSLLRAFLEDVARRYDSPPGSPVPSADTLTFRAGSPGYTLDVNAALARIDAVIFDPFTRYVELPVTQSDAATGGGLEVLQDVIISYLDAQGFIYDGQTTVASVFILDLTTGEEINLNGDVAFSAASTIKLPIMLSYFRYLNFAPSQDEAWLLANSLLCSNNSSSNLLMQIMGGDDLFAGIQYVTDTVEYLGAANTYITAPFDLGIEGQELGSNPIPQTSPNPRFNTDPDPYNQTTAEDLGSLLMLLYDCAENGSGLRVAFPDGEYTQTECQQMLELMSGNDLLRLLQAGIPVGTRISHKNGWLESIHGDAGIVYPPNGRDYVIVVFVWQAGDFFSYTEAWPLIEEISRAAWNYFVPEQPLLSRRTDLPESAQECVGNFLPPSADEVNLSDIDAWRQ
ncbi:MAG: class A beta-lactamase-related serine hydrolase [Anaerolineae bacterium]|nr:class A beta-lactamase-related serine hydrolase [Anaerolineae bacterium]